MSSLAQLISLFINIKDVRDLDIGQDRNNIVNYSGFCFE